jgi:hypothetical protein
MTTAKVPERLAQAIRAMPVDTPAGVVGTIEGAGYAIVPRSQLDELRRAWNAFNDDETGDAQYDRLGEAMMRVQSNVWSKSPSKSRGR